MHKKIKLNKHQIQTIHKIIQHFVIYIKTLVFHLLGIQFILKWLQLFFLFYLKNIQLCCKLIHKSRYRLIKGLNILYTYSQMVELNLSMLYISPSRKIALIVQHPT